MDLGLKDKVVWISGSYRGTGVRHSKRLCQRRSNSMVHGHEAGQADEVAEQIVANGGNATAVHGSLTSSEGVESIVSQIEKSCGSIDVLVNNYGTPGNTSWSDSAERWHEAWDINVVSGVRLTQRVLPAMRERGWGSGSFWEPSVLNNSG